MTSDWLGGGLIVGLAAVLWLIYLLPTWFRRNEYLATERNVVRLQQTLRILAETSEVPDEVRAEASARSVVEQQRLLKKVTVQNTPPALRAAAKIRKARAVTSGILVLSFVVAVLGGVQIAVNGAWIILVVGVISTTLCVTRLGRLAKDGRALRLPGSATDAAAAAARRASGSSAHGRPAGFAADPDSFDHELDGGLGEAHSESLSEGESGSPTWTPVPLPKPLYAGHRRFVSVVPSLSDAERAAVQAEEALRAAAAQSELALRSAHAATTDIVSASGPSTISGSLSNGTDSVASVASPSAAPAAPSRFAQMGIVDDAETGALDVDQVLARRRAG
ncbi:hypothetical protein BH09ACT6_BH09ACT6_15150 [soil metagenome]